MTDRNQLEQSIRTLENQRAILGDAVVDSSIAILRQKLPALTPEIRVKNWRTPIEHVKILLQPTQQKMPDEIQSLLERVITCWEAGDIESVKPNLEQSLALMQQQQLGYV